MYDSSGKNDLIKSLFNKTKLTSLLLSEHTTQDEFNTFMNVFGQSLSHKGFMKQNRGKFVFSKIFTPSDEAFLIFTLSRCWEPWYNEYVQNQGVGRKGRYTVKHSNQKHGGFQEEGIVRFNKICEDVKQFRNSDKRKRFEQEYMKMYALQQVKRNENENVDVSSIYQSHKPKKRKIIAYTDIDFSLDEEEHGGMMQEVGKCNMDHIILNKELAKLHSLSLFSSRNRSYKGIS